MTKDHADELIEDRDSLIERGINLVIDWAEEYCLEQKIGEPSDWFQGQNKTARDLFDHLLDKLTIRRERQ